MRFVEFSPWIELELSERGALVGDSEIVEFGRGSFILILTGVYDLTAFSMDLVINSFEFHNTLNRTFTRTALNSYRFLFLLITRSEHIIGVLVVLEL